MAAIEMNPKMGIKGIHGRMGDYVFKVRNGKQYMYYMPKRKKGLSLENGSEMARE